jgi:hypothetical protein
MCTLALAFLSLTVELEYKGYAFHFCSNHSVSQDQERSRTCIVYLNPKGNKITTTINSNTIKKNMKIIAFLTLGLG